MRRRHAISPGLSGHYQDLCISSLKGVILCRGSEISVVCAAQPATAVKKLSSRSKCVQATTPRCLCELGLVTTMAIQHACYVGGSYAGINRETRIQHSFTIPCYLHGRGAVYDSKSPVRLEMNDSDSVDKTSVLHCIMAPPANQY